MAYCKGCSSKAKCKEAGKCLKTGKKLAMAYGGAVKKTKMAVGGLKTPPKDAKGLKKLPTPVRNKMGYMKKGGMAKKGSK
jgi:hypothetical protein